MKVLYHMFGHIWGVCPLTYSPEKYALYMVGTSNKSVPEMAIDYRPSFSRWYTTWNKIIPLNIVACLSHYPKDYAIIISFISHCKSSIHVLSILPWLFRDYFMIIPLLCSILVPLATTRTSHWIAMPSIPTLRFVEATDWEDLGLTPF